MLVTPFNNSTATTGTVVHLKFVRIATPVLVLDSVEEVSAVVLVAVAVSEAAGDLVVEVDLAVVSAAAVAPVVVVALVALLVAASIAERQRPQTLSLIMPPSEENAVLSSTCAT